MTVGGWNVESHNFVAQREIKYAAGGQKFEPGAYSHCALAGLGASTQLLLEVGTVQITERILALNQMLREEIAPAGFEFLSPEEERNRSGILTFRHSTIPADRLFEALLSNDVVASLRFDRDDREWLRVSPHFYNTFAEMGKIAELLKGEL